MGFGWVWVGLGWVDENRPTDNSGSTSPSTHLIPCALAIAAHCIVIGPVCLRVGGSVTTITRNCVHRSSPQTGFVGKGSGHLQLIKFWSSRAPWNGVWGGAKIVGSSLLQPARNVCVSSERFFHFRE